MLVTVKIQLLILVHSAFTNVNNTTFHFINVVVNVETNVNILINTVEIMTLYNCYLFIYFTFKMIQNADETGESLAVQ